ncbi:helix-turn-helix domain-containing protein [Ancylobacter mangrovi]|uniref:helix-turn-helix domain-containing protein n=1 Tax=Ancylobacter mangrovi TaxID=2972472 RepID=UPI0021618988|nr:XRE family transcriptional regulator [Ancylobacter mangrovi]MCS0504776.1 XRE family transcriptional regulator [Ancylobacter mangrovi]
MMDIRPIKTDADYEWALAEVTRYFEQQPEPGSTEGDRFDVLSDLIAAYEERHFPLPDADPVEALRAFLEATGRTQQDLAVLFGSAPRASEVLRRKRALTVDMIGKLSKEWGIPADVLVRPYRLAA